MFNILQINFSERDYENIKESYEYLSTNYKYITKQLIQKRRPEILSKLDRVLILTQGLTYADLMQYIIKYKELPKCLCGQKVATKYRFAGKNSEIKNMPFKCDYEDPCEIAKVDKTLKIKKSNLEKYGVEMPLQSREIREKIKKSNLEKYGTPHVLQSALVKEKIKKSNLEKYGVDNPAKLKSVREKMYATNLERYGVEHASQNKEIKERVKAYNLEKYGVTTASQNEKIKEKTKAYFIEKYGVDNPFKVAEIQQEIASLNIEKYGVDNPFKSKEVQQRIKNLFKKRYGVDNPFKDPLIQEQCREIMLRKYGVEHALQHLEFFQKFQNTFKSYKIKTIEGRVFKLQGFEGLALDWLLNKGYSLNSIKCSLDDKSQLWFKFSHQGKEHIYYPDFLIGEDLIVEVKSTFTLYYNQELYTKMQEKAKKCISLGFKFLLLVVLPKGKKFEVIEMPFDWYLKPKEEIMPLCVK